MYCALTHIVRAQFTCTAHGCAHWPIQLALLRVQVVAIDCEHSALRRIIRAHSTSAARRCGLSRFTGLSLLRYTRCTVS